MQLKHLASNHKKHIWLLRVHAALTGAAIIAQAWLFVSVTDAVFLNDAPFREVVPDLFILLAVSLCRAGFMYFGNKTGVSLAAAVKKDVRSLLLQKMSKESVLSSSGGQTGRKVNVLLDAADEISPYFSTYIPQMIQTGIIPLMMAAAVFTQHVYSGIILLVTAPFIPLAMALAGRKSKDKADQQMERLSQFSGHFLDVLQGLVTLKVLGRSKEQKEKIAESSLEIRDATMQVLKVAFLSALSLEFISMLSIGLIAFELGLQIVVFQTVTFFSAFFILILVPDFYLLLKDYGSAFHAGRGSMGAAKLIAEELDERDVALEWGNQKLGDGPPELHLQKASYSYKNSSFALKDIDVHLKPCEKAAIVGSNGSGKTTLLHIIGGLIQPDEGRIIINGKERGAYDEMSWFGSMAYISQHPHIFSGTIAENIAIGQRKSACRQEIEDAARKAGLASMIEALNHGFDTVIGEGGRGLSGGEKQRLALARAFLKKPAFILFDEPTTGLDLHTEKILQQSIKEIGECATVVTVAHRLYTIKDADIIYYMENGRLAARGTHLELLDRSESYRSMFHMQRKEAAAK
ncbi:thiol reductant ABC exporter subunit CydD [Metabacillus sp. cB07]|uniref:thiol reductant ABC exporter subunit CydD n=1 Tax=Metabacillus sp. cB07 TaxID=2806989 RepID=UPI00193AB14A|nr:thiol reductant ABC exporter subunit CydD [Metabacillus sp. cB07]